MDSVKSNSSLNWREQAIINLTSRGFYQKLWGWVLVTANLGCFILIKIDFPFPFLIWAITLPAVVVTIIYAKRKRMKGTSVTDFDRLSRLMWTFYGITVFIVVSIGPRINWMINSIVFVMAAIPTLTTGYLLRFTPLIIGGFSFWVFGLISAFMPNETRYLIGAVAIGIGYLLPAHLMKMNFLNNPKS